MGYLAAIRAVTLLAAGLTMLASGGCGRSDPAPRHRGAAPGPEIAERGRRATKIVTSGACRGSGFFVAPTLFVTNAHVLCAEAAVIRVGDRDVEAQFEAIDDELDVAVLRTEDVTPGIVPLPLASAVDVREGEHLVAVGAPVDAGDAVTAVSGPVTRPLTSLWGVLHVEADLPLSPGNSGGPLLDARGRVVAVVSKRRIMGGRAWALGIPIDYLTGSLPTSIAVTGAGWLSRVEEAARSAAPDLERFRGALIRPLLLGAQYLPASDGGSGARELLVFVVAAPATSRGLAEVTVRLTCGATTPVPTRLSAWLPIDEPLERTTRIDVTALRPFLAWARKRAHASQLVLATGDAAVAGPRADCPGQRLTLLDGDTVTDSVAIE